MRQKFSEPKFETQVKPTRAESRKADEESILNILPPVSSWTKLICFPYFWLVFEKLQQNSIQTDFVPQTLRLRAQALWGQTRHIMITDGVVMA
jgi:hypothetical protein